jgi:hypothetical protein
MKFLGQGIYPNLDSLSSRGLRRSQGMSIEGYEGRQGRQNYQQGEDDAEVEADVPE